jgi:hypothetical protein
MYRYPFDQTRYGRQWRASAHAATHVDQTSAAPRDNTPLPRVLSAAANRELVFSGLLDHKVSRAVDMSRACPPYTVIGFAYSKVARAENASKASTPPSDKKCHDEAVTSCHFLAFSGANRRTLTHFGTSWSETTDCASRAPRKDKKCSERAKKIQSRATRVISSQLGPR